jgi:hypothetical protein
MKKYNKARALLPAVSNCYSIENKGSASRAFHAGAPEKKDWDISS